MRWDRFFWLACGCTLMLACSSDESDGAGPGSVDSTGTADVVASDGAAQDSAWGDSAASDVGMDVEALDAATDLGAADIVDTLDGRGSVEADSADAGAVDAGPVDAGPDTVDAGPPHWSDLPEGYAQVHFEALELDEDGQTADLVATAPEGTIGMTVLLSGAPKDVWMRLSKLVVPPGNPVVKNQGSVTCPTCPNRVQADQILSTAMAPNAPDVPFKSKGKYTLGAWQFSVTPINGNLVVTEYTVTPITARILWKLWPEEPTAGTLDLNLIFTGAGELTAESAPTHARIIAMLDELQAAYDAVGIQLGEVRYLDAPEGAPSAIETTLGVDSDLGTLLGSRPDAPPGVNVFFVSTIVKTELEDGSTGVVLGIAGGIPGPPWLEMGSPHSGVAVSLDDTAGDGSGEGAPDKLGSVLAHELGHYLGLYHTAEQDGGLDPIDDTPPEGGANLMYWAWSGNVSLTDGQRFVMLRHPSVWLTAPEVEP